MALVSQLLPVSDWAALNKTEREILFDFVSAELVQNDDSSAAKAQGCGIYVRR